MSSPPTAIPCSGWLQSGGGPHAGVEDGDGGDERGRERGQVHAVRVHTQVPITGRCHRPHRRPSAAPAPRVPRNRGRSRGQAYQRAGQLVGLGQGGRGRLVVPAVGVDGAEDDAGEADDADLLACSPVRSSPGPRSGWWVEGGWWVSRYRSTTRSRPSATTATSRFVTGGLLLLDLSPSPPSLAPRGRHVVEASAHLRPPSTGVLGWLLPGRRAVD